MLWRLIWVRVRVKLLRYVTRSRPQPIIELTLFQDAYILGRILADPIVNQDNVVEALEVYDAIRRPIAHEIVERSLRLGGVYELDPEVMNQDMDATKLDAGDRDELQKLVSVLRDISSIYHFTEMPEKDWDRAQTMLHGQLDRPNQGV